MHEADPEPDSSKWTVGSRFVHNKRESQKQPMELLSFLHFKQKNCLPCTHSPQCQLWERVDLPLQRIEHPRIEQWTETAYLALIALNVHFENERICRCNSENILESYRILWGSNLENKLFFVVYIKLQSYESEFVLFGSGFYLKTE